MKRMLRLVWDDCGMEIINPDDAELAWAWRDEAKEKVLIVPRRTPARDGSTRG
jgi:hypothetical protein